MNQTFVYRKHLRKPFQYLILCEVAAFILIIIMVLGLLLSDGQKMEGYNLIIAGIVILVMFLFILFELGLSYLLVLKRFRSISVTLSEDAIIYTNSKSQTIIPYGDIEKLEFPSIKYLGGWMKIIYKGGNIRLTVVLEHIGEFICGLKEKLSEREIAPVYNEKKLFSFYKTAVFSDESWERLYYNYKIQLATHYLCSILTIVILLFFGNQGNNQMFIFGSLGAPLLGYLISELIIGIRVKKRVEREKLILLPRNPAFERKVFHISIIGLAIGYLFLLLVINVI